MLSCIKWKISRSGPRYYFSIIADCGWGTSKGDRQPPVYMRIGSWGCIVEKNAFLVVAGRDARQPDFSFTVWSNIDTCRQSTSGMADR